MLTPCLNTEDIAFLQEELAGFKLNKALSKRIRSQVCLLLNRHHETEQYCDDFRSELWSVLRSYTLSTKKISLLEHKNREEAVLQVSSVKRNEPIYTSDVLEINREEQLVEQAIRSLATLPSNSLAFLREFSDRQLPDSVRVFPSVFNPEDLRAVFANQDVTFRMQQSLGTIATIGLVKTIENANTAAAQIAEEAAAYKKYHIGYLENSPWILRTFSTDINHVHSFRSLLEKRFTTSDSVLIFPRYSALPSAYMYSDPDLLISPELYSQTLPTSSLNEVEARIECLLEEGATAIALKIRELVSAETKQKDGVVVEFYTKK